MSRLYTNSNFAFLFSSYLSPEPCIISTYHHWRCEWISSLCWEALDTTLCDKDCQLLTVGR